MSSVNYPEAPKNILSSSPSKKDKSAIEKEQKKQKTFEEALNRAYDILYIRFAHSISDGDLRVQGGENPLMHAWQHACAVFDATPPKSRKKYPQIYLRYDAGDHIDLLTGPAGDEIEIPLNKKGEPIKFTPSTVLSKNCKAFRQYVKDQGYLPDGLCLLVFRLQKDWTYRIVITRDNNGPPKCLWD